jgi:hypothetical protein
LLEQGKLPPVDPKLVPASWDPNPQEENVEVQETREYASEDEDKWPEPIQPEGLDVEMTGMNSY